MNVKTTKIPPLRFKVEDSRRYGIQMYGADNLYPQNLRRITSASGTAELCLARYAEFIEGNGFLSDALSQVVINREDDTFDDLLHHLAEDVARYGGIALHVNYNLNAEITSVHHIPFEHCRLCSEDDNEYAAKVAVYSDWGCDRHNRIHDDKIDYIDLFDSDEEVVLRQIEAAGGIENYKGQVLWLSMDGKNVYPSPIYDSIITDISTDEALGNIKYRNTRNNFLVSCMLVTKKGVPRIDENGREVDSSVIEADDLLDFQGDENTSKILLVELENDEDKPEVVAFPTRNYDKEFTVTDESVVERVYAQFHQELFYSIRIGKLGFSGDVMRDAYEYYAGKVTNEQRFIQRALNKVYGMDYDFTIQPIKYINSEGQS